MERKGDEPAVEGFDERQRNRDAVTTGAEESAALSKLATEQQNRLKRGRREEAIQHKKELKKGTWKEKEKAKRDKGQQNRGKSTVRSSPPPAACAAASMLCSRLTGRRWGFAGGRREAKSQGVRRVLGVRLTAFCILLTAAELSTARWVFALLWLLSVCYCTSHT
jgi:hypothetical protein